jgi:hypothetical protein
MQDLSPDAPSKDPVVLNLKYLVLIPFAAILWSLAVLHSYHQRLSHFFHFLR